MPSFRGIYRGIYSSLVDSPDFQLLSARARHVFLTMRVMREIGPGCIWRYYRDPIVQRTGWKPREVENALVELETAVNIYQELDPWILREGCIMWIVKGLQHDPTLRLSDLKHQTAVLRSIASLPHLAIVLTFCNYYKIPRPWEGPAKGQGGVPNDPHPPSTDSEYYKQSTDNRLQTPYSPPQDGFLVFWEAYPRKTGKGAARRAWLKIRLVPDLVQRILAAVEAQKALEQWRQEGGKFIPHPATWLNQERWEDQPPEVPWGSDLPKATRQTLEAVRQFREQGDKT